MKHARRCLLEKLESRSLLFAATGYAWSDPNISFSFVPDGTDVEGYSSSLFAELDAVTSTDLWQREFARALQTWANSSNLNFHEVPDDGSPSGASGPAQGNPSFGDIRLGAHTLQSNYVAYAYYPVRFNTLGGDIFLNPDHDFNINQRYDLYSIFLHEIGHSLGIGHTSDTVMNSSYSGVLDGLTQDDIEGVQSIYGVREADSYDATAANDDIESATAVALSDSSTGTWQADLTTSVDVDYYAVTAPDESNGSLHVSLNTAGISLLSPKISVYDPSGTLLDEATADFGGQAQLDLNGVADSLTYYLSVEGATSDVFGMGAYELDVVFGIGPDPIVVEADPHESNETIDEAVELGQLVSYAEADLTVHTASDRDFFRFDTITGLYRLAVSANIPLTLRVYGWDGSLRKSTTEGSLELMISGTAYAQVEAQGDLGAYELSVERIDGLVSPVRWWDQSPFWTEIAS